MSYILDALRRADSERERGSVPHLHANPVPADIADDAGRAWRLRPWWWALAAVVLLGALAWQWLWRNQGPAAVVVTAPQPFAPRQVAASGVMAPEAAAPVVPGPGVVRLEPPRAVPPFTADEPGAAPGRAAASTVVTAAPGANAAPAPVPLLKDLPESLRRQLPALATGGAMYSDSAANRMLIINGQIYREGDSIAAELVLEQIKLNTAVLAFKGQRFSISY